MKNSLSNIEVITRLYSEYKYGKSKKNKKQIEGIIKNKKISKKDTLKILENIKNNLFQTEYDLKGGGYLSVVTEPRDDSAVFNTGTVLNIPQHVAGVILNTVAATSDSIKLLKASIRLPSEISNIASRPNEPLPSDTSVNDIFHSLI